MNNQVEVSAAVIERPDGSFLMARRPEGKVYAGWWEFPGGKVEPGETARAALDRELREELGIQVHTAWPWLNRAFVYPHAHVMLRFYRVSAWAGEPHPHEGQILDWTGAEAPGVSPILPANGPILKGLRLPVEYAISAAAELGEAAWLARLDARLADGLKLVQLREKQLPPEALERLGQEAAARCRAQGARLLVNGDPRLAARLDAGLHLPSAHLMDLDARPELEWVGASCHDADELTRAAELELDYVLLGPAAPTPSHPDAEPLGWDRLAQLIADYPLPVYALGGLDAADLPRARALGCHGIALKSGAWKETS
jgi:8-oxo-dGTP diphosphatase